MPTSVCKGILQYEVIQEISKKTEKPYYKIELFTEMDFPISLLINREQAFMAKTYSEENSPQFFTDRKE